MEDPLEMMAAFREMRIGLQEKGAGLIEDVSLRKDFAQIRKDLLDTEAYVETHFPKVTKAFETYRQEEKIGESIKEKISAEEYKKLMQYLIGKRMQIAGKVKTMKKKIYG